MLRALRLAYAVVILSFSWAQAAYAAAPEDGELEVVAPSGIELSFLDAQRLPFACDPASIEVGISCGMDGMCGQDPCLCGSADEWGSCACNGFKTVKPTYTLKTSDGGAVGFARVVEAPGGPWLVSTGPGEADVVVTAELEHHAPATALTHIKVAAFGLLDFLKIVAALAIAAAFAFAVFAIARGLCRIAMRAFAGKRIKKTRS